MRRTSVIASLAALSLAATLTACGADDTPDEGTGPDATPTEGAAGDGTSDDGDTLVIYSGRNENLVAPVLEELEAAVGIPVEVRYAGTSELAAQLLEEGSATDADLFFGQDAGALGALARADMLVELDRTVTDLVPEVYRDGGDRWVATSGRVRVLAYDPEQVPDVESLTTIDDVLAPGLEGQVGFAPANASFHAFVTGLRVARGEEGAREWLEAFAASSPEGYENNNAVLDAVDGGQVAVGLINHYYYFQKVAELGQDAVSARIHYLEPGDPGSLVNVAGAGVVAGTDNRTAAHAALEFLLSAETQQYFADTTAEYPVVEGVTSTTFDLPDLADVAENQIDLNDLDSLDQTLVMLDEVGLT
ncbi:extracellular solute-binding protein [Cellulomonas bogoriensis]|uniref:Iron ABC transporter substrate-binding protein n=1 Tax=Cellulomonas bogoriensis 69B4 = DSM 16987 TaxID=1386082 RepID=A0A0A0BZW5_9CELL|nr:extracellular solute-binding protein [Cellulomonas bogoriensis]KGM13486.1 iron ABC transporter substrate-binding protein [Cellulomonas bogoriensis 69B4 = DSM 16987]